jgi:hypothetical protein
MQYFNSYPSLDYFEKQANIGAFRGFLSGAKNLFKSPGNFTQAATTAPAPLAQASRFSGRSRAALNNTVLRRPANSFRYNTSARPQTPTYMPNYSQMINTQAVPGYGQMASNYVKNTASNVSNRLNSFARNLGAVRPLGNQGVTLNQGVKSVAQDARALNYQAQRAAHTVHQGDYGDDLVTSFYNYAVPLAQGQGVAGAIASAPVTTAAIAARGIGRIRGALSNRARYNPNSNNYSAIGRGLSKATSGLPPGFPLA